MNALGAFGILYRQVYEEYLVSSVKQFVGNTEGISLPGRRSQVFKTFKGAQVQRGIYCDS